MKLRRETLANDCAYIEDPLVIKKILARSYRKAACEPVRRFQRAKRRRQFALGVAVSKEANTAKVSSGSTRPFHVAPQQAGTIAAALDVTPGPQSSSIRRRSNLVDPHIKWLCQVEWRPSAWACKETALYLMLDW